MMVLASSAMKQLYCAVVGPKAHFRLLSALRHSPAEYTQGVWPTVVARLFRASVRGMEDGAARAAPGVDPVCPVIPSRSTL